LYHLIVGVRFGRYELLRLLGRGGMAEVFLARYVGPQGFEKRLVIKRVLPEHGHDRRFLRLFFDEARTQVSLSHGNLVPVFDFGRVGNAYFIAMEEVRGCDLGTLLAAGHRRERKLPPLLVAHLGIEVCRGLAYVHRRGYVHRDVSPRNVLVSTDGEVKLSDFGVALAAASDAAPGLRGTLAYMAPEQARSERSDGRADLFALGMVLAEALLGRRARTHADEAEALAAARAGEVAPVEGPLGVLIARATASAPDGRFADAEAMLVALEEEAAALGRVGGSATRELAACVAEWVPRAAASDEARAADEVAAVTSPTIGAETYFRDGDSERFVDEVLDEQPRQSARAARVWIAAAAVAVAAGGAALATRALRSAHHAPAAVAATGSTAPAPTTTAMPPPRVPSAVERPAPPRSDDAAPRSHLPAPRPHPGGSGTLLVRCTPWCIPSIDGETRGSDGRNHRVDLPAGVHRLSARRLDDHFERTIEITPGATLSVDFTFD
jgi:Protein kinase domain